MQIGNKATITWQVDGETKTKTGIIKMVGPNYIGLAIPYPQVQIGQPTCYWNSIPRESILQTIIEDE